MTWTRRFSAVSAAILLGGAAAALAQDEAQPKPPPAAGEGSAGASSSEISELRKAIDSQTLKIEMLTREVSELRKKLSSGDSDATPAKPATSTPTPAPEPESTPEKKEPAPGQPEVRAAEATGGGVKHIVAKGETLTSIAKQYNIPLATLQSANKIQDGRKLQIGQVLTIPSPTENSPDKKEKP